MCPAGAVVVGFSCIPLPVVSFTCQTTPTVMARSTSRPAASAKAHRKGTSAKSKNPKLHQYDTKLARLNANVLAVDALSTIDVFESAEELFLKSLNDLESAVDDGGSKGRGIVGALRKMRVAAAGMSASSGAIKKNVVKSTSSYCSYVARRKKTAAAKGSNVTIEEKVMRSIRTAQDAGTLGDPNQYGRKGSNRPKKKQKHAQPVEVTVRIAGFSTTKYSIQMKKPAQVVHFMVPNPADGMKYRPIEVVTILGQIEQKYRSALAREWKAKGHVDVTDVQCARLTQKHLNGHQVA